MNNFTPPPDELKPGSVVVAYLRDSGGTAQELSVIQQQEVLTKYCSEYGLILTRCFVDEALSGRSRKKRKALAELRLFCENEKLRPDGVLIWDTARLARNANDTVYITIELEDNYGVTVHSITDPSMPKDLKLIYRSVKGYAAEMESVTRSANTKRGLAYVASQGFSVGGFPPRGYKVEKVTLSIKRDGKPRIGNRWVPDEDIWDDVKLAWLMRAEGKSYSTIQKATGRRVFKSDTCWPSFFDNKTYLGVGKCGDLEIPNHHAAAVDQETWDKVQALRKQRSRFNDPNHPRRIGSPSLLSGLAYCVHCGAAMSRQRANEGRGCPWPYYVCSRKITHSYKICEGRQVNGRKAEEAILNTLMQRVLTVDFFYELLETVQAELADTKALDQEVERLKKQRVKFSRAISNLMDSIELAERAQLEELTGRLVERKAELAQLEAELQQLELKRGLLKVEVSPEALMMVVEFWRKQLEDAQEKADIVALKELVRNFIARIDLGYNMARVFYTFPIGSELHLIDTSGVGGT